MIGVTAADGSSTVYTYDGEGRRITKAVTSSGSTVTTTFVYDAAGELAGEYGGAPPFTLGTQYVTADQLGSTRLITAPGLGVPVATYDYLPFGDELGGPVYPTGAGGNDIKFTGKERDAETGLDFFGARYFSSAQGRFTSPDWSAKPQPIPYADLNDPQSLNLYAYVRNNPLKNRDLDGHFCVFGLGNTCTPTATSTAAQGAATGTGAQLLNDGIRRAQYQQAASQLSGPGASAARKALQADTYSNLSPIGRAMTDAAKAARVGQLAGKTAEQLAESASTTSAAWNAVGGASRAVGAVGVVVGVGMAASNIASAPEGQRGQVAAGEAGALGGGLAGGYSGAWIGGAIGSVIEPGGGTVIGAFIGSLFGGGGGAVAGQAAGNAVYKRLEDQ